MSNAPRRWKGVLYLLLFFAGFALLAYSGSRRSDPAWYQRAVLRVIAPAVSSVRSVSAALGSFFSEISRLRGAHRENLRLQAELDRALVDQVAWREELRRLHLLVGLKDAPGIERNAGLKARVLAYDPSPGRRSVWIDQGSREGVEPDRAVVAERGVVGRVLKVGKTTAQVLLLTDMNSSVDVISQRSRARGTLVGIRRQLSLDRDHWLTQAEYISAQEEIQKGDLLLTSGGDGIFPAGLPVATVTEVRKDPSGLFLTAEAVPQEEMTKLERVQVLAKEPPFPVAEEGAAK